MAKQDGGHHGKGNPAFTDEEVIQFIKNTRPRKTSEIAEQFDISDVAVRKRLKDMGQIDQFKVRNRLVWYVPHEPTPVTPDGHGGWIEHIPVEGITPTFRKVGIFFGVLGLGLAVGHVFVGGLLTLAVICLGLTSMAAFGAQKFKDKADPDFGFEDMQDHLEGKKG